MLKMSKRQVPLARAIRRAEPRSAAQPAPLDSPELSGYDPHRVLVLSHVLYYMSRHLLVLYLDQDELSTQNIHFSRYNCMSFFSFTKRQRAQPIAQVIEEARTTWYRT